MPVPKRKTSRSRRDKRSANKGMKMSSVAQCQTCQEVLEPHSACKACGHYKGIKVLRTKTERIQARSKKQEAQEVKQRAHQAVAEPAGSSEEPTKK